MNKTDFIKRMIGVPWVNRACTFAGCDCWGLVTLYYRHVIGEEIHHKAGYESNRDFLTCYREEVVFWKRETLPVESGIFVGYIGNVAEHVGLVVNGMALHSRGFNGSVRLDKLRVMEKVFTKVEYFSYASHRNSESAR
ncbi:C40 family peptidase [Budviciaceae bacterium CWB-B4]|uniref:C40 family peptidase n=1 Tax=Limnobaculum xujianqingii TaxID=2738837 RepID=A0A9D7FZ18_9GAMM|nr:NlpC/P60 family protein [Limnobaculum xujianqingii]MBK5074594.1 C40 family peptidase [Limnobaculum xujianqingii]MBK5177740.1 C40 family peptidase [Limnobaculum xujianqingii]